MSELELLEGSNSNRLLLKSDGFDKYREKILQAKWNEGIQGM
jgi:hypothetical protein